VQVVLQVHVHHVDEDATQQRIGEGPVVEAAQQQLEIRLRGEGGHRRVSRAGRR
jgi:metal-dependent amidase/aminoacylase/carboxypeptidase family protein